MKTKLINDNREIRKKLVQEQKQATELINTLRLKQNTLRTQIEKKQKQRQRIDKEINRLIRRLLLNRIIQGKNQEKFFNSHLKQNLSLKIFKRIKDGFLGP